MHANSAKTLVTDLNHKLVSMIGVKKTELRNKLLIES